MRSLVLVLAAVLALAAEPAEGRTYAAVMQAMTGHSNRQPGSPGYTAGVAGVEAALGAAGLAVHRLEYSTLVMGTRACRLEADGVEVPGILAMAPNGPVPPTTWGRDLEGPLLWLGDGSLEEMRGKPVEGCIALVRLGSTNLPQVFGQGALAVVAVGDDDTSQWDVAQMFTDAPLASPRAWIPRASAEAAGLLSGEPKHGRIRIDARWEDAAATTLWSLIPAAPGGDAEQANQVVVLAAELSTCGAVPDQTPGGREAANAALLAELAARIQAKPLGRPVLVVFLGSDRSGIDGARLVYWLIHKVHLGSRDPFPLAARLAWMGSEGERCARRAKLLADDGFLTASGDDPFWCREQLRRVLAARVNALNFRIRDLNLRRKDAVDRHDKAAQDAAEGRLDSLHDAVGVQNEMRRQLHDRRITDRPTWRGLCDELAASQTALGADLARQAGWTRGFAEFEQALAGRAAVLHFGLDLADATHPWYTNPSALSSQTGWTGWNGPQPGNFVKHLAAYQQAWDRVAAELPGAPPMRNPDQSSTWSFDVLSTPRPRSVASVAAIGIGVMGSQISTLGDELARDELPSGPVPDLLPMAPVLSRWLRQLVSGDIPIKPQWPTPSWYDDKLVWSNDGGDWKGLRVDRLSPGSEEVAGPADGALVFFATQQLAPRRGGSAPPCGRTEMALARVNPAGYVFMPGIINDDSQHRVSGIDFSDEGAPCAYFDGARATNANWYNIRLFTGFGNGFYAPFTPSEYSRQSWWNRLIGRIDSAPKLYFGGNGSAGGMAISNDQRPIKIIGSGLMILGSSEERPQGYGVPSDPLDLLTLDTIRRSAEDTAMLNRQRLGVLRAKNLVNRPVEKVNAACVDNLEDARAAREAGDVRLAAAHETMAAVLAYRAYGPLAATTNDLLQAVVILLCLSIPFAFALERMVLGSVSIYRQIAGFIGIFIATFIILYLTHPAFAIASSPLIIFLAFVIILLSGFVIFVVMGKFKQELKALQGLSARSHSTGSGNSTTLAAVIIGIAGMRNRPLKTFLTAATVTLLTFTILVFASFESGQGVVESRIGRSRGADRIEVHLASFLRIPDRLVDAIEAMHGDRFEVDRRTVSFRDPQGDEPERAVVNVALDPLTGRQAKLAAVLGVDPREAVRLGMFPGLAYPAAGGRDPLWLAKSLSDQLGVAVGGEIRVRGTSFVLAGIFDEDKLKSYENIDGTRLMPPDFDATFSAAGNKNVNQDSFNSTIAGLDTNSFVFSSAELTAVTTDRAALALGGMTNGLVLYPKDDRADMAGHAGDIASVFNAPVYASWGDGSRRFYFTDEISGSGWQDVVVPLLLGGLIIFSSLLGSIVDRQKEIFTYSALGLSPRDVGTLFFAESAVIAVLGGMGGYLIGQAVSKLLWFIGSHGWAEVPEVNFSSLSSLLTILVVMLVVILSTIYPALKAGRSANPGINRSWRMPKPEGDKLGFTFPFTVPEKSFGGIIAFIREHFSNHGDAALDVFAAKRVKLFRDGGRMGITAETALAPFDLGVYQRFTMTTRPSDIEGIDEVVVEIQLLNGAQGAWLRGNRAFIADLREQFLLWRSLPEEAVAHYQAQAAELTGGDDGGSDGPG